MQDTSGREGILSSRPYLPRRRRSGGAQHVRRKCESNMFAAGSASLRAARCGQSSEGENTTISRCRSVFLCVVDVFDVMIDCRPRVGLQPGASLETFPGRRPIRRRDAWDSACFSCSVMQRRAVALHVVWKRRGWPQPASAEWLRCRLWSSSVACRRVLTRRRLRFDDTNNNRPVGGEETTSEQDERLTGWRVAGGGRRAARRSIASRQCAMWRLVSTPNLHRTGSLHYRSASTRLPRIAHRASRITHHASLSPTKVLVSCTTAAKIPHLHDVHRLRPMPRPRRSPLRSRKHYGHWISTANR